MGSALCKSKLTTNWTTCKLHESSFNLTRIISSQIVKCLSQSNRETLFPGNERWNSQSAITDHWLFCKCQVEVWRFYFQVVIFVCNLDFGLADVRFSIFLVGSDGMEKNLWTSSSFWCMAFIYVCFLFIFSKLLGKKTSKICQDVWDPNYPQHHHSKPRPPPPRGLSNLCSNLLG